MKIKVLTHIFGNITLSSIHVTTHLRRFKCWHADFTEAAFYNTLSSALDWSLLKVSLDLKKLRHDGVVACNDISMPSLMKMCQLL
jgi:hypothetical protein